MNPLQMTPLSADATLFMQTKQDVVDENKSYYGYAVPGALATEAKWLIVEVLKTGNVISKRFASDSVNFDKVWDDRAGYTY
ncbi:MAG: hypothetical protein WCS77_00040 [Elusimicrobiaceae bacterium]